MRLPGWRAMVALAMGLLSSICLADECQTTLRVGAQRNEADRDQTILQDVAIGLGWCLVWDARQTSIARRLALLREGDIDLIYDASRTEERARYSWFSDPYREERILLFVRRDDAVRYGVIHSFDDLLNSRAILVALRNAWMGPSYARHRDAILKEQSGYEVDRVAQGRAMLLMHHADVFLAPRTFSDLLQQEHEDGIVPLDWTLYRAPVYFMFSRKTVSVSQVGQFNHELGRVLQKPRKS